MNYNRQIHQRFKFQTNLEPFLLSKDIANYKINIDIKSNRVKETIEAATS